MTKMPADRPPETRGHAQIPTYTDSSCKTINHTQIPASTDTPSETRGHAQISCIYRHTTQSWGACPHHPEPGATPRFPASTDTPPKARGKPTFSASADTLLKAKRQAQIFWLHQLVQKSHRFYCSNLGM